MKRFKLTFLIDSPDNWMVPLVKEFINQITVAHDARLIYKETDISEGDILFILSFYKLVSPKYLALNKHNIVVHASKLPQGKGWSPATWQILEGKNNIPLTIFEAFEKVDAGDIYDVSEVVLDGTELINEWQEKMGRKIMEMAGKFINQYPNNTGVPQTGESSFYPRRTPKDSELNISKSIKEQFNQFRVADNEKYPAYFNIKGKKFVLKIYKED